MEEPTPSTWNDHWLYTYLWLADWFFFCLPSGKASRWDVWPRTRSQAKGSQAMLPSWTNKIRFFNGSTCLVFFQLFCRGAARLRMETQSSFFWFQSYWEINPQQGDMMTKVEFLQNLQCFKLDHLNGCVITVFCRGYIPTFLWKSH